MTQEEYFIVNDDFEFNGKTYNCTHAIKRDIKMIIQEAEASHKDSFDKIYDRQSLTPDKVRIFLDEKGNPIFGMVIYLISYKNGSGKRTACGGYYTFVKNTLLPHFYQESICW